MPESLDATALALDLSSDTNDESPISSVAFSGETELADFDNIGTIHKVAPDKIEAIQVAFANRRDKIIETLPDIVQQICDCEVVLRVPNVFPNDATNGDKLRPIHIKFGDYLSFDISFADKEDYYAFIANKLTTLHAIIYMAKALHLEEVRREEMMKTFQSMVHRFRNSLSVVIASVTFIKSDFTDPEVPEAIDDSIAAAISAEEFCIEIMDLTNLQNQELKLKQTDISKLLTDLIRARNTTSTNITYRGRINGQNLSAPLDVKKFRSFVLDELLINAKKILEASKTESPTIEVSVDQDGGILIIKISNNGPKILGNPEHIFDMYNRGQSGFITPGFGVGLTSCRRICRAHGGDVIAANNVNGNGVTFTITLPIKNETGTDHLPI